MKRLILFAFLAALACHAQQGTIHGSGDPRTLTPVPNCANSRLYVDDSTQLLYVAGNGSPCVWSPYVAAGGPPGSINVQNYPYNASGSPVTTTTVGTTAVGSSVVLASSASFLAGQGIYIAGAGAAGASYIGTVTSVAGNKLGLTPATSTSVSTGAVVMHDESAALQAAITTSAGATIYLPPGTYNINGAPQNTGTANAVLQVPTIPFTNPCTQYQLAVTLEGDPATVMGGNAGTIIKTIGTPGANLLGGYATGTACIAGLNNFTAVTLVLHNIHFVTATQNPNFTMVNALHIANFHTNNVSCDPGNTLEQGVTTPTHSGAACFIMPDNGNNGEQEMDGMTSTMGFYWSVEANDHARIINLFCQQEFTCLHIMGGDHNDQFDRVVGQQVTNLVDGNNGAFVNIDSLGGETVSNILGTGTRMYGNIYVACNNLTCNVSGSAPAAIPGLKVINKVQQNAIQNITADATLLWYDQRQLATITGATTLTLLSNMVGTGMGPYNVCNNSTSTSPLTIAGGGASVPTSLAAGTCVILYAEPSASGGWGLY